MKSFLMNLYNFALEAINNIMSTKYAWERKYKKIRLLDKGGNGSVFEVSVKYETEDKHKHLALKQLNTDASKKKKKRFLKEIQAVSKGLKDVNGIIPILDYSTNEYWYVMPLATGLTEHINSNGLKFDDIITIAIKLAKTMDIFHSKGFSHRDMKLIDVRGDIVTADAMSCQKEIVKEIVRKGADYTIGLKGNQPKLESDTIEWFDAFGDTLEALKTDDIGHGRIEHREYRLLTSLSWLGQRKEWTGLKGLGMVRSHVIDKKTGKETEFVRYFITSLTNLEEFSYSVRKHWSIENQLHWRLDVIFREDASKAKKDNSPLNLNVMRKVSVSLLQQQATDCTADKTQKKFF